MTKLLLTPERTGLDRYLEDTEIVDWQTPAVMERARALSQDTSDETELLGAIFHFVRDEISHSDDAGDDRVTCRASQVLREGTGLCFAKSHLFAALARARGVPVGFAYQRLRDPATARGFSLHGFVGVWLHAQERWAPLDPRGNRDPVRTEFDLVTASLAYAPDAGEGERTLPLLWARPARVITDFLSRAERLSQVRRYLPSDL